MAPFDRASPREPLEIGLDRLRSSTDQALSPVARLRRLAALERGDLLVVVVYAVGIGVVSLAVPIAAQTLFNTVAFTALLQPIVVLGLLVFLGLAIAGLLRAFQFVVVETLQQRLFVRATHDTAKRILDADVEAFAQHSPRETINRFFDVAIVQKAASGLLLDGLSVVLQSAVSLVLLAFYHPVLFAFDVVLIVLIAFVVFGLGRNGVATAVKESKTKYATAAWLEEMAGASRMLKPEPSRAFAFSRADELATAYVGARSKHFNVLIRQTVALYLLQALATAALLGLGGALVVAGQLTLGQLVAAELIVTGVLTSVAKFGKYLESYYDLAASIDKLGVIIDLSGERPGGVAGPQHDGPAHLVVEGVTYAYGDEAVLRGVSFEVPPGAKVAVLGGDASGKSTLVEVLYGLRSADRGRFVLDGVDSRALSLTDLRRTVALVALPELVDTTVAENIAFGREAVNVGAVAEALEIVDLSDEIAALPEGVMTRLGASGCRLTSTQATRLALARAVAGAPRLLIIDGTLDSLGPDTALQVLRRIASARPSTSVLLFTSRPELAAAVGPYLLLERGRIAGTEVAS